MDEKYDRFKNEEPRSEGRGRTAAKRAAKEVEEVARQLVDLPEAEVAKLPISGEVRKELETTRRTTGRGGAKRQLKHFAGMLRRYEEEREELEAWLAGYHASHHQEVQAFHDLEKLRERLCDSQLGAQALAEVRERFPRLNVKKLQGLIRSVQASKDKKAFRDIFRMLKEEAGS